MTAADDYADWEYEREKADYSDAPHDDQDPDDEDEQPDYDG
jgi:hypothetical protein